MRGGKALAARTLLSKKYSEKYNLRRFILYTRFFAWIGPCERIAMTVSKPKTP